MVRRKVSTVSSSPADTFGPVSCTNFSVEVLSVLLAATRSLLNCWRSFRMASRASLASRRTSSRIFFFSDISDHENCHLKIKLRICTVSSEFILYPLIDRQWHERSPRQGLLCVERGAAS